MLRQWWIDVRVRLAELFARGGLHSRADEEVQCHLAMLEQRLIESGVPPPLARARARRQFGNVIAITERTRDSWRYAVMDTFVRDLRFATRALRKNPGFSLTAILILGVSIGASTAIFSAFDALVLHPLPYRAPEQLVEITEDYTRFDIARMQLAAVELDDVRALTSSYSHLAGIRAGDFTLTGGGLAEGVAGLQVSALSYVVNQRRREVVIRVAMGAQPAQVVELVARQGLLAVTLGIGAGLAAALAVSRLLTSRLYEMSPNDPIVYASVTGLLVLTALAATAVPALRAATLDPVVALREE